MKMDINQKKEFIVVTAIDLIHENGMNNVSTKEIAKRLGISEGMIFKIYPKKSDLILAVIDHFSLYDKDMFHTAQDKYEDAVEAILFYLNKYLNFYENYPAITAVYQIIDSSYGISQIDEMSKGINFNRLEHLKQLISRAQAEERLIQTANPEIVADILYSTFKGMCTKWRQMNYEFSLKERTIEAVKLILKGLAVK